jgi:chorismate synthase
MSIQAVKGVEVGIGLRGRTSSGLGRSTIPSSPPRETAGGTPGSRSNRAGGLEGGSPPASPLLVRGAMKPISTLAGRLPSVDLRDGSARGRGRGAERCLRRPRGRRGGGGDGALVAADALITKFGGDSVSETRRNFDGYLAYLTERGFGERR